MSSNQVSSDTDNQDDSQDSSEGNIKPNAIYEIVQAVRKETQLSHEMSKVAVETVLISLRVSQPASLKIKIIQISLEKKEIYVVNYCKLSYQFKLPLLATREIA